MSNPPIFVWQCGATRAARLSGDPHFAAEHVRKLAISGDAGAQLSWALMLLDGHGTTRDLDAAFRWFQLAARSGHRDAMNMVGRCHELGWGTAINLGLAAHCYRAAAEVGHAWAQFNLACLILREDGVPGELTEALCLLARAAHRRNAKAMNMLGRACEEGWRGPPKPAAARRWYLRAARGGCFRGAFHTARHLIALGEIGPAVVWLRRSISSAPADFCDELGRLLANQADDRLRALSVRAFAQSRRAAIHPPGHSLQSDDPGPTRAVRPKRRRGRPDIVRALRRVVASVGAVR